MLTKLTTSTIVFDKLSISIITKTRNCRVYVISVFSACDGYFQGVKTTYYCKSQN